MRDKILLKIAAVSFVVVMFVSCTVSFIAVDNHYERVQDLGWR